MDNKQVKIVDFENKHASDFMVLNIEWLENYFHVEAYDKEVLSKPEEYILNKGGHILMALIDGKAIGTVALIKRGENVYELTKMAVTNDFQGFRIGQKLMYAVINLAGQIGTTRLFLDSNRRLKPALNLYNKVGFKEIPQDENSPYERCDIRMELFI